IGSLGDGVKLPHQLSGLRIVGADEALFLAVLVAQAAAQALDHLTLGDDGSAAGAVGAVGAVADDRVPLVLAGPRVQGENLRLSRGYVDLVVVNCQAALRVAGGGLEIGRASCR